MPNWCDNLLLIAGHPAAVDAFRVAVQPTTGLNAHGKATSFSLTAAGTPPVWMSEDDVQDWRICNWGTKWDVEADEPQRATLGDLDVLAYRFESAWDAPVAALAKASNLADVTLHLAWSEPSTIGCGYHRLRAGAETAAITGPEQAPLPMLALTDPNHPGFLLAAPYADPGWPGTLETINPDHADADVVAQTLARRTPDDSGIAGPCAQAITVIAHQRPDWTLSARYAVLPVGTNAARPR